VTPSRPAPETPSRPAPATSVASSRPTSETPAPSPEQWRAAVEAVRATSPRHGKSLAFGRLVRLAPGEVVIAFTPEADFHRSTVSGSGRATIEQILSSAFGRPTRLVIDNTGAPQAPQSIAEVEAKERAAHERTTEARVRSHPAVQSAIKILGGEVEHVQVLERERPVAPEPEPGDDPT
jgi:hypothetical protein